MSPTPDEAGTVSRLFTSIRADSGVVASLSSRLAAGLALGALIGVGLATGSDSTMGLTGGLASGILFAVSIATIGKNNLLASLAGGVGLLAAVVILCALIVVGDASGFVIGSALVGLGVMRFWVDAFGDGAISRAIALLLRAGGVVGLGAVFTIVLRIDIGSVTGLSTGSAFAELLTPTTESGLIVGFVVVSWLALGGIWIAVTALPPASTVPQTARRRYQAGKSQTLTSAGVGLGVGSILCAMISLVSLQTSIGSWLIDPTVGVLIESPLVRSALLRLSLAGLVAAIAIVVGRSLGADALIGETSWSASGVALVGGLFSIAVLAAAPAIETLNSALDIPFLEASMAVVGPTATGLGGGLLGFVAVGLVLSVCALLSGSGLLPTTTAGPRLVVAGLLSVAIVGVTAGTSPIVVLLVAVVAVVVWDIAVFGIHVRSDLGSVAHHRDGELVHAGASLGVGSLASVGTVSVYWLLTNAQISTDEATVAVLLSTVAVVVVSILLGRQ